MADILIIDDETSLVNSLGFALRAEGYAVTSAPTGEAGLAAAQAVAALAGAPRPAGSPTAPGSTSSTGSAPRSPTPRW